MPPEPPKPPDSVDNIDPIEICIIRDTKEILKALFVRLLTDDEIDRLDDILHEYMITSDEYFELVESYIPVDDPVPVIYQTIENIANKPLSADF